MTAPASAPAAPEAQPLPPSRNAAVHRCCLARERSLESSRKNRLDDYNTNQDAIDAYREAMPDLFGYENIRDFIACITHGMLIDVINSIEGAKLLYAAQVATGALHKDPESKKHPPTPYPVVTICLLNSNDSERKHFAHSQN